MGFGVGMLMTAAGAIMIWAVNDNNVSESAVNIHRVGWVLFVVGLVAAALSLIFWQSLGGVPGFAHGRRKLTMDEQGRTTEERTTSY